MHAVVRYWSSERCIDELISEHSTEEITAEQEQSADYLQECIMLGDDVFFITG